MWRMAFARSVKVVVDRAAMKRMTGPNGPVDAETRSRAVKVAAIARTLVGVKSGTLRRSIRVVRSRRPAWAVEAGRNPRAPYALVHHTGRKALPRKRPDSNRPLYVFEAGGETVFTPGPIKAVAANPYLVEAARRAGMKVKLRGGR